MLVDLLRKSTETLLTRWIDLPDKGPHRETVRVSIRSHDTPEYLSALQTLGIDPKANNGQLATKSELFAAVALEQVKMGATEEDVEKIKVDQKEQADRIEQQTKDNAEVIEAGFRTGVYPERYTVKDAGLVASAVFEHLVDAVVIVSHDGEENRVSDTDAKAAFESQDPVPRLIKRLTDDSADDGEPMEHKTKLGGHPSGAVLTIQVLAAAVQTEEFRRLLVPKSKPSGSIEGTRATEGQKPALVAA